MTNLIQRFAESGDAAWELEDTAVVVASQLELNKDVIYVQWGFRQFLLNRNYIGKPKIVSNGDARIL